MKRKKLYPAVLRQIEDNNVEVVYPDFPACSGQLSQERTAIETAQRILTEHVAAVCLGGGTLPVPSKLAQIELKNEESLIFVAVSLS